MLEPRHHYSEEEFSTLGDIKETNVYLKISDLETWKQLMG